MYTTCASDTFYTFSDTKNAGVVKAAFGRVGMIPFGLTYCSIQVSLSTTPLPCLKQLGETWWYVTLCVRCAVGAKGWAPHCKFCYILRGHQCLWPLTGDLVTSVQNIAGCVSQQGDQKTTPIDCRIASCFETIGNPPGNDNFTTIPENPNVQQEQHVSYYTQTHDNSCIFLPSQL